ncbi:hypothetical protein SASPL_135583 [Salvia splendens]|uniref:Uncharacterized protein n=1 Tax=Salvia splendens TaxID=180675 RepID=A0A8X8WWS0_SALSN|nr:hypothetical protein SASPL_135583 [Salvia splendens]
MEGFAYPEPIIYWEKLMHKVKNNFKAYSIPIAIGGPTHPTQRQHVTEDLHEFYTHSGIQSFLQIGKQEQLLLLDSLLLAIENFEISKNRYLIV